MKIINYFNAWLSMSNWIFYVASWRNKRVGTSCTPNVQACHKKPSYYAMWKNEPYWNTLDYRVRKQKPAANYAWLNTWNVPGVLVRPSSRFCLELFLSFSIVKKLRKYSMFRDCETLRTDEWPKQWLNSTRTVLFHRALYICIISKIVELY